jgi:lipid II:glycine glycyltransferase (peptidoglycan interpeptide bridge formation enzyme)
MLDQFLELDEKPYTEDDAEWDAFVAAHPNGSTLQTTQWARLKNRFGWRSHRVWLKQEGQLVAGAQILVRPYAWGLVKIAYIPHGPLVNWQDDEQVSVILNQIDFGAYERGAGMLKMEPLLWLGETSPEEWSKICQVHECFNNSDNIQPPQTLIVDLTAPEEQILARMKQKTRYNIKLATKKGVTVRRGGGDDVRLFNELMRETGQRNQFGVHAPEYYQSAYELFAPENLGLFIAEYDSRPLAAIMVFVNGTRAAYFYGASSSAERKRMPTYLVQWTAMQWAKERGCTEYDLWGVPDYPEEDLEKHFQERKEGLWGVYRFKRGFGGNIKRTVGSADRVYNNIVYRLYQWRRGNRGDQRIVPPT